MARLIVFEGIDGSGKTTLSRMFFTHLIQTGVQAVWLREPTDSPSGDRIREIASRNHSIPVEEELHYFIEDRKWDVTFNIQPALQAGKTVVMDRYFYSNACYQGARGLDMKLIIDLNRAFAPDADLVFVIDTTPDIALSRIRSTHRELAILFEKKRLLEKVRKNYFKLKRWVPNLLIIDGNDDIQTVFRRILDVYQPPPTTHSDQS